MDFPQRRRLPHQIPSWIDPSRETYFLTLGCRPRHVNQLTHPELATNLFATVAFRQIKNVWYVHLLVLMPDHLHALVTFPAGGQSILAVVTAWKRWTANALGIRWRRDFFEHRLRGEDSLRAKADYILANPVRGGLVTRPEDWPYVWFGDGTR